MIYGIKAYLDSPLAISHKPAMGNELDTLRYIPGATLRGALAEYCIARGRGPDSNEFRLLFLNGRVQYGDLRIEGAERWPLSARVCSEDEKGHQVADLLLPAGGRKASDQDCECAAKRKPAEGYCREEEPGRWVGAEIATRRLAHVEIDPRLLRFKTQQFHTSRVVSERQAFEGEVRADGEAAAALESVIDGEILLRMGRGRTRGQGKVRLTATALPEMRGDVLGRLRDLQAKAAEFSGLSGKTVVSCTLVSRAVLQDEYLFSRDWICSEDCGGALKGYDLTAWFSRTVRVTGWHAAAGMPRSGATAIDAGSCFLFSKAGGLTEMELEELATKLAAVEELGIGARRDEGMGEVRFCHRFHSECAEVGR